LELTVIPLVVCFLTLPAVYKYLTPVLSGGKVVLKQGSLLRYMLFALCMSIAFNILFIVLAVGGAMAITPYVRDFVNSADDLTMAFVGGGFRGIIGQSVFFVLTLVAGKFCKKTLLVEGKFNAWKAAWAPAFVTVFCMWVVSFLMSRFLYPQ
jgi:hypothetical protein